MGLFDVFKKNNDDSQKQVNSLAVEDEPAKLLSVEDATSRLYNALAIYTGWKFLKSQRCLKKTIGDLVFQIDFFTSKWNTSYERVEVQCECQMWCKKFDKELNVNSQIGYYPLNPSNVVWHDISDEQKLSDVIAQISERLNETIMPLSKAFEEDFTSAATQLAEEHNFQKYHIRLQFLDVYVGRQYIYKLARNYVDSLSDVMKQDMLKYKQGDRSKSWMINPSNLKYIIDNDLLDEA